MTVRFETYYSEISVNMTRARAERIKHLRCGVMHNYKDVSSVAYEEWGVHATWPAAGCPKAGEALCVCAARWLKENPYTAPWS